MKAVESARRELDFRTNLPAIGPRQFWRVRYVSTPDVYGSGHYVQLMEFRPTVWRPYHAVVLAEHGVTLTADEASNAENIREAAEQVLSARRRKQVIRGVLGDYPPNRL